VSCDRRSSFIRLCSFSAYSKKTDNSLRNAELDSCENADGNAPTNSCTFWIVPGRDGFTGGCGEGVHPLSLARGGAGGVLFFMIKQKIIREKMRYAVI
jgi:hypothetical protein